MKSIYDTFMTRAISPQMIHKPARQIRIAFGENVLIGKLNDSKTSRELIDLLPLSIQLTDLFGVQKYVRLPQDLSETGQQVHTFEAGDIAYWAPGPGLSIFYRQHQAMTDSGLYLIGHIEAGAQLLNFGQYKELNIELI